MSTDSNIIHYTGDPDNNDKKIIINVGTIGHIDHSDPGSRLAGVLLNLINHEVHCVNLKYNYKIKGYDLDKIIFDEYVDKFKQSITIHCNPEVTCEVYEPVKKTPKERRNFHNSFISSKMKHY